MKSRGIIETVIFEFILKQLDLKMVLTGLADLQVGLMVGLAVFMYHGVC